MISPDASEISRVLSTAVAPVFLITSISSILATVIARYGRVIDRIRTLLRDGPKLYLKKVGQDHLDIELKTLYRRARLLRFTIGLEIASVFSVVLTIAMIFLSLFLEVNFNIFPALFFIISLSLLLLGLFTFLRDFWLSLTCIENDMRARSSVDPAFIENE